MLNFILLTTQRSGATFVIKCLDNHPQIRCDYRTVFTQDSKWKFFSVDRPSSFYYKYRSSSLGRRLAHWFNREKLIHACLDDYLLTQPREVKAVGLKISYNHIDKYPAISTWIKAHGVRVVHLVRYNVLKTLVSSETAKRRGIHQSTQSVAPVKVHLHPDKVTRHLKRRIRVVEKYRQYFVEQPYLEVEYESFVANQDVELSRMLQFLEVDAHLPASADLVKLNSDSLKAIIANYDEVAHALEGTALEKYLTI